MWLVTFYCGVCTWESSHTSASVDWLHGGKEDLYHSAWLESLCSSKTFYQECILPEFMLEFPIWRGFLVSLSRTYNLLSSFMSVYSTSGSLLMPQARNCLLFSVGVQCILQVSNMCCLHQWAKSDKTKVIPLAVPPAPQNWNVGHNSTLPFPMVKVQDGLFMIIVNELVPPWGGVWSGWSEISFLTHFWLFSLLRDHLEYYNFLSDI